MVPLQISFEQLLGIIDQLSEDQKQLVLERILSGTKQDTKLTTPKKHVAGLGEGTVQMSNDFIDPLTEE